MREMWARCAILATSTPSVTSGASSKETSPEAVTPVTVALRRPVGMSPKLPTAAVPTRAGRPLDQVVPASDHAGSVRHT